MLHHWQGVRADHTGTTLTLGNAHYSHVVNNLNPIFTSLVWYKEQGSFKR